MSPKLYLTMNHNDRFPRVSGDEPGPVVWVTWEASFSPRERG